MGKGLRPQGGLGATLVSTASREASRHATTYWATVVSVGRETVDVMPDDRSGLQYRIPVSGGPARKDMRVLITVLGGLPTAQIPGIAGETTASPSIQSVGAIGAGGAPTGPIAVHDLDGPYHTSTLDDAQAPQFLLLDGSRAMTNGLDMDSHFVVNVLDPLSPQDAATKAYVDAAASGGSVTSVALTMPTGFSVSGSPVTTSGTLGVTITADVDIGSHKLINVTTPSSSTDAATKGYVDGIAGSGTTFLTVQIFS